MSIYAWQLADDVEQVHRFLLESDKNTNDTIPLRSKLKTERLVKTKSTYILRGDSEMIAMFSLTIPPPTYIRSQLFTSGVNPIYLQRLALSHKRVENRAVIAIKTLRHAQFMANTNKCDVIRCELNPNIIGTFALFKSFGFTMVADSILLNDDNKVYMQKLVCQSM